MINNLINEELTMQEANKRQVKIDNIALNREIENIAKQHAHFARSNEEKDIACTTNLIFVS